MPVPKTVMFGRRGAAIVGTILGFTILFKLHSTESSSETLPVIGYIANKADNPDRLTVFRQGLAELGYVEGRTSLSSSGSLTWIATTRVLCPSW